MAYRKRLTKRYIEMKESDFSYINQGIFTLFLPNNGKAVEAWKLIAEQTDGTGKVFTHHAKSTVAQLKKAGYTVSKTKLVKITDADLDQMFNELED